MKNLRYVFYKFFNLASGCDGLREIVPERYRATTADRYAGETKQNAEVTAKKSAACKQPALPGSRRAPRRVARKVKFTVDRHHQYATLRNAHVRARSHACTRVYSRYFSSLRGDTKSKGCKNSAVEGKGRKAQPPPEYWCESLVRLLCQLVTVSLPRPINTKSVEIQLYRCSYTCVFLLYANDLWILILLVIEKLDLLIVMKQNTHVAIYFFIYVCLTKRMLISNNLETINIYIGN